MPRLPLPIPVLCSALVLAACSGKGDGGPGVPHSVTIQPGAAGLCIGDSLAFTAEVRDDRGDPVVGAQVRWTSSVPSTVAIDTASGMAHALAFGAAQITATAGGVGSASPARLDVPQDLSPEFVPDTVVLAPGDTFTLGVRLRRLSSGPVPARTPVIAPLASAVASLDSAGLVTANAAGLQGFSLSACGFTGHGAARVFTPTDSVTGLAYLWLSGSAELRYTMPARGYNFALKNGHPAFQIASGVGPSPSPSRAFLYEDTLTLATAGRFPVDSLLLAEVTGTLPCAPPRPFATYADQSALTLLLGLRGGWTTVTSFAPKTGYTAVSGRTVAMMRGSVSGGTQLDTLQAIYTFSAPLVDSAGACP